MKTNERFSVSPVNEDRSRNYRSEVSFFFNFLFLSLYILTLLLVCIT